MRITRRLYQALEILEIPLLEHYIFAEKTYAPILRRCIDVQERVHDETMKVATAPVSWKRNKP